MATAAIFHVHGPGGPRERPVELVPEPPRRPRRPTNADDVPVTSIMSRSVTCALATLPLDALTTLVVSQRLGCVPIVDDHLHPVGMVTKLDLVELCRTPPRQLAPVAGDVMMPLAITLDHRATVAHAAALMASEDMHHVMIVSGRSLVGVVSTMDVTRWLARNDRLESTG